VMLLNNKRELINNSAASSGLLLRGQVRDIKVIKTAKGVIYVVAINNKPLRFFKWNN